MNSRWECQPKAQVILLLRRSKCTIPVPLAKRDSNKGEELCFMNIALHVLYVLCYLVHTHAKMYL